MGAGDALSSSGNVRNNNKAQTRAELHDPQRSAHHLQTEMQMSSSLRKAQASEKTMSLLQISCRMLRLVKHAGAGQFARFFFSNTVSYDDSCDFSGGSVISVK